MTEIINLNEKRPPVVYHATITQYHDGTHEVFIEGVSDDERSRKAVMDAFRCVSGAEKEIEKLKADLKKELWADSEYCKEIEKENVELRVYIAELEEALWPFAFAADNLEKGGSTIEIAAYHFRNALEVIRTED